MKQQSKKTDVPKLKVTACYTGKGNTCIVSIKEVNSLSLAKIVSPSDMSGVGGCYGEALADYTAQLDKYLERLIQFRNRVLNSERAYKEAVHVDFAGNPVDPVCEDVTGLTLKEIEALKAFKAYFDDLYGKGLEVANWHRNGNLEAFDNFYESAKEAGRVHCKDCDYLNMDSGKPHCCHPRMSTNGLNDWCYNGRRKENG